MFQQHQFVAATSRLRRLRNAFKELGVCHVVFEEADELDCRRECLGVVGGHDVHKGLQKAQVITKKRKCDHILSVPYFPRLQHHPKHDDSGFRHLLHHREYQAVNEFGRRHLRSFMASEFSCRFFDILVLSRSRCKRHHAQQKTDDLKFEVEKVPCHARFQGQRQRRS